MTEYDAAAAELRAVSAATAETRDLIRYATLAPNGHNTQAWLFRPGENRIAILPDFTRRTPVVDPDDHHVFVSLGCAAENLAIAAGAAVRAGEIVFDPSGDGSILVNFGAGSGGERALFDAIPQGNRRGPTMMGRLSLRPTCTCWRQQQRFRASMSCW